MSSEFAQSHKSLKQLYLRKLAKEPMALTPNLKLRRVYLVPCFMSSWKNLSMLPLSIYKAILWPKGRAATEYFSGMGPLSFSQRLVHSPHCKSPVFKPPIPPCSLSPPVSQDQVFLKILHNFFPPV